MKPSIRILSDFVRPADRVSAGGVHALPPAAPAPADPLAAKRAAALAWLGDAWLLDAKHAPRRCPPRPRTIGRLARLRAELQS